MLKPYTLYWLLYISAGNLKNEEFLQKYFIRKALGRKNMHNIIFQCYDMIYDKTTCFT